MDVIKTYLDNVFAGFSQTAQVRALKEEMLASMEEKYHALIEDGKSEHEAAYSVIADFGSIDEIAAELGLGTTELEEVPDKDVLSLTREETEAYISHARRGSLQIGLGVWLILCGVAGFIFFGNAGGLFALFASLAVAIVLFVINGIKFEQYEIYQQKVICLDGLTKAEVERGRMEFRKRFAVQLSLGIGVIILSVGLFLWQSTGLFLWERFSSGAMWLVPTLPMIGFGIFLLVPAGVRYSAYDILLNRGEYANKRRSTRTERLIGVVASIYWPLATAIYLLWSFLSGDWSRTWVVWPVAGVLFGGIAGGIATWGYWEEK